MIRVNIKPRPGHILVFRIGDAEDLSAGCADKADWWTLPCPQDDQPQDAHAQRWQTSLRRYMQSAGWACATTSLRQLCRWWRKQALYEASHHSHGPFKYEAVYGGKRYARLLAYEVPVEHVYKFHHQCTFYPGKAVACYFL